MSNSCVNEKSREVVKYKQPGLHNIFRGFLKDQVI